MTFREGKFAETPRAIPARGWWQIARRAWGEVSRDRISLTAAGIAFYGLLALFPAVTALLAISGLILEPENVANQIASIASMIPEQAAEIVVGQATEVAGSRQSGLGLAAVFGLLIALYSASKGVGSLMEGVNLAYDESESRGFLHLKATQIGLTVFLIVGVIFAIALTLGLPAVLAVVSLGAVAELLIGLARWVILLGAAFFAIAVIYRIAPCRSAAKWRWLTPGAVLACILWLLASIGFSIYAENFASYNETFGALTGVIVLLMWLWLSAFVILLGAELNAETEAQTGVDTTVGKAMPSGMRGAVKADSAPPDPSPET